MQSNNTIKINGSFSSWQQDTKLVDQLLPKHNSNDELVDSKALKHNNTLSWLIQQ